MKEVLETMGLTSLIVATVLGEELEFSSFWFLSCGTSQVIIFLIVPVLLLFTMKAI